MHRMIRWLALGAAVLLLAACSHNKDTNAPLTYVPANTPYVVANLEPLTDEARAGLMPASASASAWQAQVEQWQHTADMLDAKGKTHLASVLRTLADSAQGKSYEQFVANNGIDPEGRFAFYGLGLTPVLRGQLADPAKFHAYLDKLAKAYGTPLAKATLGERDYRHVTLGESGLQLVVATHDKHYVMALVPAKADTKQLRRALGLDRPEKSLQATNRLSELAEANGYGPYVVGYVDTTRLPGLMAGANDPFLRALVNSSSDTDHPADIAKVLPASCKADLSRIAERAPLISFGYSALTARHQAPQVDIRLAPDIVKAFKGTGTQVAGMGASSNAPLDIAVALPMPAIRNFWLAQAEAVASNPFTCPVLKPLNKAFARLQKVLPKTAMPPIGALRGFRLVLDHIDASTLGNLDQHQPPNLSGRLLITSKNPVGLLNLAKAMLPAVATLDVKSDSEPVALPEALTSRTQMPAWVAMSDTALVIGIGDGEKDELRAALHADSGAPGMLAHAHVAGKLYLAWLETVGDKMANMQAKGTGNNKQTLEARRAIANAKAQLAATRERLQNLKDVTSHVRLTDHGLRITGDVRWK